MCGSAAGALQNLSREIASRQAIRELGAVPALARLLSCPDAQVCCSQQPAACSDVQEKRGSPFEAQLCMTPMQGRHARTFSSPLSVSTCKWLSPQDARGMPHTRDPPRVAYYLCKMTTGRAGAGVRRGRAPEHPGTRAGGAAGRGRGAPRAWAPDEGCARAVPGALMHWRRPAFASLGQTEILQSCEESWAGRLYSKIYTGHGSAFEFTASLHGCWGTCKPRSCNERSPSAKPDPYMGQPGKGL